MAIDPDLLARITKYDYDLDLHYTSSWTSQHDDYGHTHCKNCGETIRTGDACIVHYYQFCSFGFCMNCYSENTDYFSSLMKKDKLGSTTA